MIFPIINNVTLNVNSISTLMYEAIYKGDYKWIFLKKNYNFDVTRKNTNCKFVIFIFNKRSVVRVLLKSTELVIYIETKKNILLKFSSLSCKIICSVSLKKIRHNIPSGIKLFTGPIYHSQNFTYYPRKSLVVSLVKTLAPLILTNVNKEM